MANETVTINRQILVDLQEALWTVANLQSAIRRICGQQPESEDVLVIVSGVSACLEAMERAIDAPEDALADALDAVLAAA